MKVKLSTTILAVILSVFYFQIVSCNRVTNPNKAINEIDPKYLKPGQLEKTSGYKFQEGFIFHEWKGEEPDIKKVVFYKLKGEEPAIEKTVAYEYSNKYTIWVRKMISSKYFNIYVDISTERPTYEKAKNIKDTVWDKLIKYLEELHPKVINIYGSSGGSIDIVFHEGGKDFKDKRYAGYFYGSYDVISVNSAHYISSHMEEFSKDAKATILHELQHSIYYRREKSNGGSYYCYNEALSESTYNVFLDRNSLMRGENFEASSNGQYFFDWDINNPPKNAAANYSTAAGFMYWLYIHGGGEKIIKDIVSISKSRNKLIDHKSIADAARRNIPYYVGFEGDYNPLIFCWYKANFYNNPSGLLGYKGKVTIRLRLASASGGKISLQPQCAIYTTQDVYDRNKNIGDTNIWLAKLSDSSRKWLLIYNSGSEAVTVYTKNGGVRIPTWGKDKSWGHTKPNPIKLIQ